MKIYKSKYSFQNAEEIVFDDYDDVIRSVIAIYNWPKTKPYDGFSNVCFNDGYNLHPIPSWWYAVT